jgi:hypothetical protein
VSHHEQQASEHGDEQQHQELSPAYNRNPAPPQASTQGLSQQVRDVTPTIASPCDLAHNGLRDSDWQRALSLATYSLSTRWM